uniref:Glycosyltransferase family 92 protein n=1 Tax=Strongyloides stercoralis TaxID=6248 RepID=A0AAF5I0Z0_STRER
MNSTVFIFNRGRKICTSPLLIFIFSFFLIIYLIISKNSVEEEYLTYINKSIHLEKNYDKLFKIAIIIVTENKNHFDNYKLALTSLECYANGRNYIFKILDFNENKNLSIICPQEDFFFARHCAVGKYLEDHEKYIDYGFVLDGDIGVINPNKFLEEYLPKHDEELIVMTQRLFTHEIAASPYIVKNCFKGRNFLYEWSEYFYRTPSNFHGADNGALMQLFMHKFGNYSYTKQINRCYDLYEHLSEWKRFRSYTICVMAILYQISINKNIDDDLIFDNGSIRIVKRFPFKSFVRDIWETKSQICDNDFFLHGLKDSNMGRNVPFGHWENPLIIKEFDLEKCNFPNFTEMWQYNKNFILQSSKVYSMLLSVKLKTENEHNNSVYSKISKLNDDLSIDNNIYIISIFEDKIEETKIILFTISSYSTRTIPFDNIQKLKKYRYEDTLKLTYSSYQGKIIDSQSWESFLFKYSLDKIYQKKVFSIPIDNNVNGFSVCTPILFNFPNLGKIIHFFKYWKSQKASYFIIYYHSWTIEIDDFVNDIKNELNVEIVFWSNLPFDPNYNDYLNPNFQTNYHFQRLAELDCIYRSKNKVKFAIQPQLTEEINIDNVDFYFSQMIELYPDVSGFRLPVYSKIITNIDELREHA